MGGGGARRRGAGLVPGEHIDKAFVRAGGAGRATASCSSARRIFEYQPTMLHAKSLVVDDAWASVGWVNFDNRSFQLPGRGNALRAVRGRSAGRLAEGFERDLEVSEALRAGPLGAAPAAGPGPGDGHAPHAPRAVSGPTCGVTGGAADRVPPHMAVILGAAVEGDSPLVERARGAWSERLKEAASTAIAEVVRRVAARIVGRDDADDITPGRLSAGLPPAALRSYRATRPSAPAAASVAPPRPRSEHPRHPQARGRRPRRGRGALRGQSCAAGAAHPGRVARGPRAPRDRLETRARRAAPEHSAVPRAARP